MLFFVKKPIFTTSPTRLLLALLKYQFMIIKGMQSMYTSGNINITDSRNTFGSDENDIE